MDAEFLQYIIQFAPAVSALLWLVYRLQAANDKLTQRIIECYRQADEDKLQAASILMQASQKDTLSATEKD